jgi:hypothetical protein
MPFRFDRLVAYALAWLAVVLLVGAVSKQAGYRAGYEAARKGAQVAIQHHIDSDAEVTARLCGIAVPGGAGQVCHAGDEGFRPECSK